jgi:ATP-binding cassette subfamily F protein uup
VPLVALDHITHAYGHLPLLSDASLQIEPGERVAIIGRNGTGKSTLLRIVSGELPPDQGTVWCQPGATLARLEQDVPLSRAGTVFDAVAEGLGPLAGLVRDYHDATQAVATDHSEAALARLGRCQQALDEHDGWRLEQRVQLVLSRLSLDGDARVETLSGGWKRRVLLARALVAQPDVLLLDEPTNHLDVEALEWLEQALLEYAGAVLFVTHDRAFLERLATRIVELDRGHLTSWPGDYATFQRKKDEWLANEALQQAAFDRKLAQEEAWIRRGIKARRTRDEGRVKRLMAMRAERAERRERLGQVRLQTSEAERSGAVVFDVQHLTLAFGPRVIVRDFTTRIMRGDRIGLIGPNGAGKTTLLRLLLGELTPDSGSVTRGTNVQVAYFDQQREQLDPDRTVVDTLADGNDTVEVNGQRRHVYGYLEDFLFSPERARSPVRALSGGERNRLLLARLLTRPANVLVLDEPTNDLDLETLELLEALLVDWTGTLLVVSHDRRFLDHVITSTLSFGPDGRVIELVGGYDDWKRQTQAMAAVAGDATRVTAPASSPSSVAVGGASAAESAGAGAAVGGTASRTGTQTTSPSPGPDRPRPRKLSFSEQRELEALPARIEALDAELDRLTAELHAPDFYTRGASAIAEVMQRVEAIPGELDAAYARWDALEQIRVAFERRT